MIGSTQPSMPDDTSATRHHTHWRMTLPCNIPCILKVIILGEQKLQWVIGYTMSNTNESIYLFSVHCALKHQFCKLKIQTIIKTRKPWVRGKHAGRSGVAILTIICKPINTAWDLSLWMVLNFDIIQLSNRINQIIICCIVVAVVLRGGGRLRGTGSVVHWSSAKRVINMHILI